MKMKIAKANMLKQQLHTDGILDESVLKVFHDISRELFVAEDYHHLAYADMEIPLAHNRRMLKPIIEAKILQALAIKPTDKVLEIGTGAGYLTALLAELAYHVYSIDVHEDLIQNAQKKLTQLHIHNVTLQVGNATHGWEKQMPYDVIVITGSMDFLPETFNEQLAINGRLFVVMNTPPAMQAHLIVRTGDRSWENRILFETSIAPLENAPKKEAFVF